MWPPLWIVATHVTAVKVTPHPYSFSGITLSNDSGAGRWIATRRRICTKQILILVHDLDIHVIWTGRQYIDSKQVKPVQWACEDGCSWIIVITYIANNTIE